MSEVTRILAAVERGEPSAATELLPLVYDELRRLAAHHLAAERPGHTLQATALVHEAYIRLVGSDVGANWNGRGHFFGAAAEAMRRILVDAARRKGRGKHGGGRVRLDVAALDVPAAGERDGEVLALDPALDALAREHPEKAELVKLRYFGGLTIDQAAACLGVSPATAKRQWAVARAWLYRHLTAEENS